MNRYALAWPLRCHATSRRHPNEWVVDQDASELELQSECHRQQSKSLIFLRRLYYLCVIAVRLRYRQFVCNPSREFPIKRSLDRCVLTPFYTITYEVRHDAQHIGANYSQPLFLVVQYKLHCHLTQAMPIHAQTHQFVQVPSRLFLSQTIHVPHLVEYLYRRQEAAYLQKLRLPGR